MTEAQKKQLFIELCLTKKDKQNLSNPMNTRHSQMFDAFKIGLELSSEVFK